ncbi:hypothetical protein ABPG75_008176 [Micractinium tetrahymenae]
MPAVMLLVSRRWQRVYLSQPALWGHLSLGLPHGARCCPDVAARWFWAQQQRMQRVGALVTSLRVEDGAAIQQAGACTLWNWQLADLLAGLDPSALSRLKLACEPVMPGGVGNWLQRLSGLTTLHLRAGVAIQPLLAAALRRQQRLLSLDLGVHEAEDSLVEGLQGLPQLTCLRLDLQAPCCTSLLPLSCLQALRELRVQAAADDMPLCLTLPTLAAFSCLCSYSLSSGGQAVLQVAGQQMTYAKYFPVWDDHEPSGLRIDGWQGTALLWALLGSLLPAHLPLEWLAFTDCRLPAPAVHHCQALQSITYLGLERCGGAGHGGPEGLDAALGALLGQAWQLEHLCFARCLRRGDPFPGSIAALPQGITFLELKRNHLADLPPAPCLGRPDQAGPAAQLPANAATGAGQGHRSHSPGRFAQRRFHPGLGGHGLGGAAGGGQPAPV